MESSTGIVISEKEKANSLDTEKYLLRLAQDPEALLSPEEYPDVLTIPPTLHKKLDELKKLTKRNVREFTTIVAQNAQRSGIYYSTAMPGEPLSIPFEVKWDAIANAMQAGDIRLFDDYLGSIHSHPPLRKSRILPFRRLFDPGTFSAGDLHSLLQRNIGDHFMGVVAGDEKLFAFRSTHTPLDISTDPDLASFDKFEQHWYSRAGFHVLENGIVPLRPDASFTSLWEMNVEIAKTYGLALYKGQAGSDLHRVPLK
ncbi:MAG TPA: hypothetical protein VJC10_02165 [Patescibacteria group bacterium]|nr:hypothetical protein [Patescibacteria group bacterium]